MKSNIELTYDLIDLQLTFLVFGNQLYEDDLLSLKNEFFKILTALKGLNIFSINKIYSDPDEIINLMKKKYGLKDDFAVSKYRGRDDYVFWRQKAMVLCRHIFKKTLSLREIGYYFGGKTHASILHAFKSVRNMCDTDKKYKQEFDEMQLYFLGKIEIFN